MRTALWFLVLVTFYLHDKCVKSRDIPKGFQTTFQTVADFIKSFVAKSSSAALDMLSTGSGGKARKKPARGKKHFIHHAWEQGEAKYQNATDNKNGTAYQLTVSEVAQWHGYQIETHMVKTMDGFFLTTHRLAGVSLLRNRTVLLHHGLLGSAMDWILLGPGECMLPFTLAEAGYDVWFMNARGNIYSRSHATLTLSMPAFWDFSFEEMGLMDIPAVIDYIRRQNDVPIDFVAHSMGSTAFLVYLSSLSENKKYLRTGVLIAPVAFMGNVTGPLRSVPDNTFKPIRGEFLPHRKVPQKLASTYCKGPIKLCRNPLFFLSGLPTKTSFTSRVRDHVPAGGSVKTIMHYMQLVKSGRFHRYKNKTHQYDMHSIDVPLAFISSNNDELAIVKNIQRIYGLIKYPIAHYIIRNKNVSHTDLLWDKTAACVVFRKTLEYLVRGHKKHMYNNNKKLMDKNKSVGDEDINDNNNDDDNNEDDTKDKDADSHNDNKNDGNEGKGKDIYNVNEDFKNDEDEVTSKANDKENNDNKTHNDNNDKRRIKVKVLKGKSESNDLGESENNTKAYKFILEVQGEDIIVKKLEDNQTSIKDNVEMDHYTETNNKQSDDKSEDEIIRKVINQYEDTGSGINNDEGQSKNEQQKCENANGKENDTCTDDINDYGHIFYDGPEAYMDFQVKKRNVHT